MGMPRAGFLAARRQTLQPEFAPRFKQEVAWFSVCPNLLPEQATVDQGGNAFEDGGGRGPVPAPCLLRPLDRLRRRQCEPAGEDRQSAEQRLCRERQQVVAP